VLKKSINALHFPQNDQNFGDGKCLGKPRKSFVGHPDAIFFCEFRGREFFNTVCANGPRETFVLMRMAAGKKNKKQLDMLNSVIVNYNSVAPRFIGADRRQRITLDREQRRNELLEENET